MDVIVVVKLAGYPARDAEIVSKESCALVPSVSRLANRIRDVGIGAPVFAWHLRGVC
jgi:hypothetical protein